MYSLGDKALTIDDITQILFENKQIKPSSNALKRVKDSFDFLHSYNKDKVIYGINTGLGPMAQYSVCDKDRIVLQYNAIRSHCSGMGQKIPDICVKAAMLCSLNSYLKGHSGIHPEVIELLTELINRSLIPVVPEHGGVGASGDLVQLAHIALILIGEGEISYKGQILPTADVFKAEGLKPISIHLREGLSLINGTYVMTGISLVNLLDAKNLLSWAVAASAMINEIVLSFDDYFSNELNTIKVHKGQQTIAAQIRDILTDSNLIRKREDYFFNKLNKDDYIEDKIQEYYSVRCVPQVLGPVYDTLQNASNTLINEANSTSDNPLIDINSKSIFHGGNFHGDYVASEADKMKMGVVKLSMLLEKQLSFLLNPKLNNKLPPFVNLGRLGVNFGMQGAQFTATSTAAENQSLAYPMHLHSIACNNDNQDIVSMGTNAALLCKKTIENSYQILAIELMTIMQAIDYLKIEDRMASQTLRIYKNIRQLAPAFTEDTVRSKDLNKILEYVSTHNTTSQKIR